MQPAAIALDLPVVHAGLCSRWRPVVGADSFKPETSKNIHYLSLYRKNQQPLLLANGRRLQSTKK